MNQPNLPDHLARISPGEPFSFLCHRKIDCFTHCCCHLELALTPYDILRLRQATGLSSSDLLEKYVIIEHEANDTFPRFYLAMIDDGKASCAFVTESGCSIYEHRPGACRTYPMGRATVRTGHVLEEFFVLLHEPHCHGFREHTIQTIETFTKSQGLETYNKFNDLVAEILQHEKIRAGMKPSASQISNYTLALYDIDTFRLELEAGRLGQVGEVPAGMFDDNEMLLSYSVAWLKKTLFG